MELERYRVGSLAKGLQLLRLFAKEQRALTLSEVAQKIGWNKVTTYRFLVTLQAEGYIDQDAVSKQYSMTSRVMDLGFGYLNGLGYPERALPYLRRLSEATGHSTNLSVLDGTEIVYLARVASRSLLSMNLHVGARLPAYCTSMGKVLLAGLSEPELEACLSRLRFDARTPKTLHRRRDLLTVLQTVRRQGFAINDQELEVGLRSAAVPVLDSQSRVVAAINVSVPAAHVTVAELTGTLVPRLIATGREISATLGKAYAERA